MNFKLIENVLQHIYIQYIQEEAVAMDEGLTITLISVAMFVGSFLLGFIPLLFRLSEILRHICRIRLTSQPLWADGFALGAATATGQVTVQVIVFFAVILHKAPAAFGLVSFLMHVGLEKKDIQGHLLAFSAAAPVVAISTYFILDGVREYTLATSH
ncbi:hypothetical protein XENOCAPTIV_000803 [Xenoophorus captivus]|uniref:Zinc transporter ZIP9 n=1 Tax=Xenoophorus captivus TaxID=1517983 RepID=A0ABV0QUK4_9TELE